MVVRADPNVKESDKLDKYQDIGRELKKQWNKMTMIPVVFRFLGTVPKNREKRLDELKIKETIQITTKLISARILRRVLKTRGDLLSNRLQWKKNLLELARKTRKITCYRENFAIPTDYKVKIK